MPDGLEFQAPGLTRQITGAADIHAYLTWLFGLIESLELHCASITGDDRARVAEWTGSVQVHGERRRYGLVERLVALPGGPPRWGLFFDTLTLARPAGQPAATAQQHLFSVEDGR